MNLFTPRLRKTGKANVIETRWELPARVPLCCSIDFCNSRCVSVKSLPISKKYLSIFFCILTINQLDQKSKNVALEILLEQSILRWDFFCYEIEGKPIFGL